MPMTSIVHATFLRKTFRKNTTLAVANIVWLFQAFTNILPQGLLYAVQVEKIKSVYNWSRKASRPGFAPGFFVDFIGGLLVVFR